MPLHDGAEAAPTPWRVETGVFEGPMDLLLYLVRRDGIDLAAFSVREVTDAYLGYLDRMRELHLGVAGEYLVMAATLCWLKSLELLPRPPAVLDDEEEGEDPREALARQLREYQALREGAGVLEERVWVGREVFTRAPEEVDPTGQPVVSPIDAFGLLDVYYGLLTREAAPEPEIALGGRGPDLLDCCQRVLDHVTRGEGRAELGAVLSALPTRVERVATFVAVLEMARLEWLDLRQESHLGPVHLELRAEGSVDLERITGELVREAG